MPSWPFSLSLPLCLSACLFFLPLFYLPSSFDGWPPVGGGFATGRDRGETRERGEAAGAGCVLYAGALSMRPCVRVLLAMMVPARSVATTTKNRRGGGGGPSGRTHDPSQDPPSTQPYGFEDHPLPYPAIRRSTTTDFSSLRPRRGSRTTDGENKNATSETGKIVDAASTGERAGRAAPGRKFERESR